jgi:putative membrane protein
MPHNRFLRLALIIFLLYCSVFPGSVITVALDAVPPWGEPMGVALLVLQGAAVVCWMLGMYGRRGAVAVVGAFVLAWAVEHVGETTGFPFGRYQYTDMLQPQIAGVVPVPITLAWLMAAFGSWQLARLALGERAPLAGTLALTGALVVVLDLQIETVATFVNPYWRWIDGGPYYGVPTVNFVAWFAVGALMALIVTLALGNTRRAAAGERRVGFVVAHIPALLYILSSIMFTVVNLSRGYPLAGVVGVVFLVTVVALSGRVQGRSMPSLENSPSKIS